MRIVYLYLPSVFQHYIALLQKFVFIGSCLSDDLVAVEAKHKLRLSPYVVVALDLRRNIRVDFEDFDLVELIGDQMDVLVSDFAGWIPPGCEVD